MNRAAWIVSLGLVAAGTAAALGGRQRERLEVVWVHDVPGAGADVCLWPDGDTAPGDWLHEGPEVVCEDGLARPRLVDLGDRHRSSNYRPTPAVIRGDAGEWHLYARVVETWKHRWDHGQIDRLDFLADGHLAGHGDCRWERADGRLHMRWPDGRAPGGAWADDCAVSEDGESYDGWNQVGTGIHGTRVRD